MLENGGAITWLRNGQPVAIDAPVDGTGQQAVVEEVRLLNAKVATARHEIVDPRLVKHDLASADYCTGGIARDAGIAASVQNQGDVLIGRCPGLRSD